MSNSDLFQGYKGKALETLMKFNVRVWGQTEMKTTRGKFSGTVLPRSVNDDAEHIVLKIETGYNIGVNVDTITSMKEIGFRKASLAIPEKEFPYSKNMPKVKLFGTGGTIASRLDYRTGAVIPAFSPGELYGAVPELADICNLETEKLFAVFSENMGPEQYIALAHAIKREVENGIDGIVIGHGTDTLQHTAAALSFMCQNLPIPVILVGSQRSSDRPSSDAPLNLMHAMRAAGSGDIAEVLVCMYASESDDYGFLHKATRVRKMHSSRRNTFRTIGDTPVAKVTTEAVFPIKDDYNRRRKDTNMIFKPYFSDKVSMLYYYPGMKPEVLDSLIDLGYEGIVIVGAGLGHVNKEIYPAIERAKEKGVHIFMTLQTLWGYVQMFVYDTGRDMMAKGIIPLENMLPEVAFVKLSWVLGQTKDPEKVRELMLTPINDEITERENHNGYVVLQGGVSKLDEFLRNIKEI